MRVMAMPFVEWGHGPRAVSLELLTQKDECQLTPHIFSPHNSEGLFPSC
jgi:hypothetical protein